MFYRIVPLEPRSIVEREIFHKTNMEIKCGLVWKLGAIITSVKPTFIKTYEPNLGIRIKDIDGAQISETFKSQKVIYFSETIPDDYQDELSEIFYGISKKYSGTYQDIFQDLGWKLTNRDSFIFGELGIREIPGSSHQTINGYQ
jgi:hypothetical protein